MARARDALTRVSQPRPPQRADPAADQWKVLPPALGSVALLFIVLGLIWGHHGLVTLGLVLAGAGAVSLAARRGLNPAPGIGMGATVARDAQVDPTASVDMGAAIDSGAKLAARSVVRMGAHIGKDAVLEEGATVSWGVSIGAGAVVGKGASVGAGSEVLPGAKVPPGFTLMPGTTYGAKHENELPPPPKPAPIDDPRVARVQAACDKLSRELEASPERMREMLGGSGQIVEALRLTCADLIRRERELRLESDTSQLESERAVIASRAAAEADPQIKASLNGALAAIDGQKQQRESLRLTAERLAAEHTRLLYTLEHLSAQFVRMRSAGADIARPQAELQQGVSQLRDELDAISEALEAVAVPPPDSDSPTQTSSVQQRSRAKT
jgi:carbonic anhydrase/acetyltransferase-like protein (isoleucine patch superfamily)/archaellum component FlaC